MIVDGSNGETYKMRQGESLGDLTPIREALEECFGEVNRKTATVFDGSRADTMHVVDNPEVAGLTGVAAGRVSHTNKKDTLGVVFEEADPTKIDDTEAAKKAITAKNGFLEAVTGRSIENRQQSMRRTKSKSSRRPTMGDLL